MSKKNRIFKASCLICEYIKIGGKNIMLDMDLKFGAFKTKEEA